MIMSDCPKAGFREWLFLGSGRLIIDLLKHIGIFIVGVLIILALVLLVVLETVTVGLLAFWWGFISNRYPDWGKYKLTKWVVDKFDPQTRDGI